MPRILSLNNKTCRYEPKTYIDFRYNKPRISDRKHSYTKHNSGMRAAKYLIYFIVLLLIISAVGSLIK